MYLSIRLLKNIWSDSTFLVPVGKAAVSVCVCVHIHLHFPWASDREWNCWSYNSSVLSSSRICLANSRHSHTTHIPMKNKSESPSFTVLPTHSNVHLSNLVFLACIK